jgi:uncharacterized membrane protein
MNRRISYPNALYVPQPNPKSPKNQKLPKQQAKKIRQQMTESDAQTTPIRQNATEAITGATQKVLDLPAVSSDLTAD